MRAVLGELRAQSHETLPAANSFYHKGKSNLSYAELEEEIRRQRLNNLELQLKCDSLVNSVWTLEHAMGARSKSNEAVDVEMQSLKLETLPNPIKTFPNQRKSSPTEEEWKSALQTVLMEKQELVALLKQYQKLALAYREHDYDSFVKAVEVGFHQSQQCITAADEIIWPNSNTVSGLIETEFNEMEKGPLEKILLAQEEEEEEEEEEGGDHNCIKKNSEDDPIRLGGCSSSPPKDEVESSSGWWRRPSGSSSFLYAGVELHPSPARPPTRISNSSKKVYLDVSIEVDQIDLPSPPPSPPSNNNRVLPALTLLSKGTWLYKYPRRMYSKLISQNSIPTNQLSWRFFWLQPQRAILLWSPTPTSDEAKQVQVLDFYTETRTLPRDGAPSEQATIIVILTGQENPLTLVPSTNEDLATWIAGLQALLKMRLDPSWPENLAFCTSITTGR